MHSPTVIPVFQVKIAQRRKASVKVLAAEDGECLNFHRNAARKMAVTLVQQALGATRVPPHVKATALELGSENLQRPVVLRIAAPLTDKCAA